MDDFEQFLKNQPLRAAPPAWRAEILAAARPPARANAAASWRAWLWPSPYAWGALAAAWVVILVLNAASQPGRSLTPRGPQLTGEQMAAILNDQRRELAEILAVSKAEQTAPTSATPVTAPGAWLKPREANETQYA